MHLDSMRVAVMVYLCDVGTRDNSLEVILILTLGLKLTVAALYLF
jgi:hypothetical protein